METRTDDASGSDRPVFVSAATAACPIRRPVLAASAALVSLSAFAGAFGLAGGTLGLGDRLTARLPFGSPVVGGLALGTAVGLPFAALAAEAGRGSARADRVSVACGTTLVGWILVELAFLREVSFLHPLFAAVGGAFVVAGRRGCHRG